MLPQLQRLAMLPWLRISLVRSSPLHRERPLLEIGSYAPVLQGVVWFEQYVLVTCCQGI